MNSGADGGIWCHTAMLDTQTKKALDKGFFWKCGRIAAA
jgi:hypothetical protein